MVAEKMTNEQRQSRILKRMRKILSDTGSITQVEFEQITRVIDREEALEKVLAKIERQLENKKRRTA